MKTINVFVAAAFSVFAALPVAVRAGATAHPAQAAALPDTEAVVAVDWKSLEHREGLTEVWATNTFPLTITLGHGLYPHRSQRLHYAIDCDQHQFAVSQWLLTDEATGAGQVVWSGRADSLRFASPWPGSPEERLMSEACARRPGVFFARGF